MVVTVPVTFNTAYVTPTMGTFIQSNDVNDRWTDFRQFGNWTVPGASLKAGPNIVSASPSAGVGTSAVFTIKGSHSRGIPFFGEMHIRINTEIVQGKPCHVIYSPAVNMMSIINDAGTQVIGPVPIGQPLTTSRCSVPAGANRTISGNEVTLTLPVEFNAAAFGTGTKNVYINGFDVLGAVTHWIQTGTWTVQ
jgi:hypothetical protein